MPYDKTIHHRRSIRLPGYDYSIPDFYFITICTDNKKCIFGHIRNGKMVLNKHGQVAYDSWKWLEQKYPYVRLHEFVIMPNHMHGIIEILSTDACAVGAGGNPPNRSQGERLNPKNVIGGCSAEGAFPRAPTDELLFQNLRMKPIGELVGAFKTVTTNKIRKLYGNNIKIWQRNYYEHIVRDNKDYENIRGYILTNPQTLVSA